jgi:phosphoribosylglycinamide formyltransferase-1
MKSKICFLVSGNGGTLKFLYHAIEIGELPYEISHVFADRDCNALTFSKEKNIKSDQLVFNNDNWDIIMDYVVKNEISLVITNIHRIVPAKVIEKLPNKFLNLHYSLLPAYKGYIGMKTVDLAKESKVKIIGGTAHLIDKQIDEGIIVTQGAIKVNWDFEIKEIYNEIFQVSCLTFLNAITILLQSHTTCEAYCDKEMPYFFSPNLQYNPTVFNTSFWRKIK